MLFINVFRGVRSMSQSMLDRRHTALMLVAVFAATFMDGLDSSIVSIVLPTIAEDLGVDTATSSWATITYLVVLAGLIIPFARIASQVGVRRILAYGFGIFTVGSALCGLSPSFEVLIASRAVQAVGASMMAAAAPMCCTEHLPFDKLATGMAVVTIGASVGFAMGPVVGGVIAAFTTWHWIFLLNIPIGIVMVPLILKAVPASAETGGRADLDKKGTAILFVGSLVGILGVEMLAYSERRLFSFACIVLCIIILYLFVRVEKKTDVPLLKISMFRNLGFTSIFLCLMLINSAYMGVLYLVPFYGQVVLGHDTLYVGMYMLIAAAITAVIGMPVARWSDRKGRRWFCVTAGAAVTVCFTLYGLWADGMTDLQFLIVVIFQGVGWGFVGGPMASRLVEHAGDERDMASSLMNEAYYVGGALGTAVTAAVFTILSGSEGVDIPDLTSGQFLDGFVPMMIICAAIAAVVLILSFVLKDDDKH